MEAHTLSRDAMADAAERVWGFRTFRPLQEDAVRAAVGGTDSLVVLPTGGGKSLCYQLPPLLTGGLTLVVSPLIALMEDQLAGLKLNGYPAAAFHSATSDDDTAEAFRALDNGEVRLLLASPERAVTRGFQSRLASAGVTAIAIDEAHCISQWGHDFRPEYRRLRELRSCFPGVSVHAYTATATPKVRDDIADQLGLIDPEILVGTFDRPNLTYRVVPRVRPADQIAQILAERHKDRAAIVYCMSRRETEQVAAALLARGFSAAHYHAGMNPERRADVQDRFLTEKLDVVVATVAFGMGIDRSDVRCVIHATMPKSIEAYQQETGRAGRDGLAAECVLLYSSSDASKWSRLIESNAEDIDAVRPQLDQLEQVRRLLSGARCRHRALSEHFGQAYPHDDCNACDVCLKEVTPIEGSTVVAQKIMSCVARLGEATGNAYGSGHIADILRGSRSKRIADRGHDRLSTFGLLSGMPRETIISCIDQLVDTDLLLRTADEYPVIRLTEHSLGVLRGETDTALLAPPRVTAERGPRGRTEDDTPLTNDQVNTFERLRQLRRRLADEQGVPPYVVFNDATLRDMVRKAPADSDAMLEVKGVGQAKVE
ncbi:MAG: RecQ family ATP-dependent DNA helicase, partial [Planctomycetota bacterium]